MSANNKRELRSSLQGILQAMYPTLNELYAVAEKVYCPQDTESKRKVRERARQARDYGKSPVVMIELIMGGINITAEDIPKYITQIRKSFQFKEELSVLDELINELVARIGVNELIAWLRLRIAQDQIRESLKLKAPTKKPKQ